MERVKSALLVVDVQNDFISGTLALARCPAGQEGSAVVPVINTLLLSVGACFDMVAYTQDWHPPDHISFYENRSKRPLKQTSVLGCGAEDVQCYESVMFDVEGEGVKQILWPSHCVQDSWGAALYPDLMWPGARFVKKGACPDKDSYSAFFDNSGVLCTELHALLKGDGVSRIYVCGLAYDYCVGSTALDSRRLGYDTIVIEDACRGVSVKSIDDMRHQLSAAGATFCHSSQVQSLLTESHSG